MTSGDMRPCSVVLFRRRILWIPLLLAAFGLAVPSCTKKSREDATIKVDDHDPEMNAAIAKARELLPSFWKTFDHPERGEEKFALKVRITDGSGSEHFWTNEIERKDGKIFGTINNDPDMVKSVKIGQRIEIPAADISDWMYLRDDKMVGNYTMRVLFREMPTKEVEFYKAHLAEP